jgi:RHS repeat-associated protein
MKKTSALAILSLVFSQLLAQHEPIQPFEEFGKVKILTLSNGKYQETFSNDTIMRIGSVMFHRFTGEVVTVVEDDTLYGEYSLQPEAVSRWLSPDPLGAKFPNWSPYNYAMNNPVLFIDPDGREVIAPSQASKNLVLQSMNTMFGRDHGYSFSGDKLVHNGAVNAKWSKEQGAMFSYFNDALVNSETQTFVRAGESQEWSSNQGRPTLFTVAGDASATTFPVEGYSLEFEPGNPKAGKLEVPGKNEILLTQNTLGNGTNVETAGGQEHIGSDMALLHEFGHAIVNTIMMEFGGQFNGVDFNKMTEGQRADWSIRFTNTLRKSNNQSQETGEGQHKRKPNEKSPNSLNPINN